MWHVPSNVLGATPSLIESVWLPLQVLALQGMNADNLYQVTHALIISRPRYALPVWCRFLTINRVEGLIKTHAMWIRTGLVFRLFVGTGTDCMLHHTIQYNIRLLHRSQTATTSNMKQMNTKYNYLIVETKE